MMGLAVVPVFEQNILALCQWEDNMASSNKKPLGIIPTLPNKENTSVPSPRCRLCIDRKTKCGDKRYISIYNGFRRVTGFAKLGTSQVGNNQLADLNINISNTIFSKKLLVTGDHSDTVLIRKRSGYNANPEDDRGSRLFGVSLVYLMQMMSVFVYFIPIKSRRLWRFGARLFEKTASSRWLPTG